MTVKGVHVQVQAVHTGFWVSVMAYYPSMKRGQWRRARETAEVLEAIGLPTRIVEGY